MNSEKTYLALLRGINVGGKHMVKMQHLRQLLSGIGLCSVQTYIQSGNVLFVSSGEEAALRQTIEAALHQSLGFAVPVVLRTAAELEAILRDCPFTPEEIVSARASTDAEVFYVYLFDSPPAAADLEKLAEKSTGNDRCRAGKRELYLLCHQSIRNSKLAMNLQKLPGTMTARNWNTLQKLAALSREMEGGAAL